MESGKFAEIAAVSLASLMAVSAATSSAAHVKPDQFSPVVVTGARIDPALQRQISYVDLNLNLPAAQKLLRWRISRTAANLCFEINNDFDPDSECRKFAIRGTRPQVTAAIERAKLRIAGKAVGPDLAISMAIMGR